LLKSEVGAECVAEPPPAATPKAESRAANGV